LRIPLSPKRKKPFFKPGEKPRGKKKGYATDTGGKNKTFVGKNKPREIKFKKKKPKV